MYRAQSVHHPYVHNTVSPSSVCTGHSQSITHLYSTYSVHHSSVQCTQSTTGLYSTDLWGQEDPACHPSPFLTGPGLLSALCRLQSKNNNERERERERFQQFNTVSLKNGAVSLHPANVTEYVPIKKSKDSNDSHSNQDKFKCSCDLENGSWSLNPVWLCKVSALCARSGHCSSAVCEKWTTFNGCEC